MLGVLTTTDVFDNKVVRPIIRLQQPCAFLYICCSICYLLSGCRVVYATYVY